MKRQTQLFLDPSLKPRKSHGGDIAKGKRKFARPIATKSPMHIVLRSHRARGALNMLNAGNRRRIEARLRADARKFHVKILGFANVGNHLHISAQAKTRRGFIAFLRTFTGMVARLCTGAKKGQARGPFWEKLAFTRVVSWGRDQQALDRYLNLNKQEVRFSVEDRKTIRAALAEYDHAATFWRLFPPGLS